MIANDYVCIRQWKSDGSRNCMTLRNAVANLASNMVIDADRRAIHVRSIRQSLLDGKQLETENAVFWMPTPHRPLSDIVTPGRKT